MARWDLIKHEKNIQWDFYSKWIGLVWLFGLLTIVGHSMPNPFYTYIKYMISKHVLKVKFLNYLV